MNITSVAGTIILSRRAERPTRRSYPGPAQHRRRRICLASRPRHLPMDRARVSRAERPNGRCRSSQCCTARQEQPATKSLFASLHGSRPFAISNLSRNRRLAGAIRRLTKLKWPTFVPDLMAYFGSSPKLAIRRKVEHVPDTASCIGVPPISEVVGSNGSVALLPKGGFHALRQIDMP
jgi:hypothetical protein